MSTAAAAPLPLPEWAVTPAKVEAAVARIAAAVHPRRVIAFGSRARGDARVDSDLDLLVILPDGQTTTGVSTRLLGLMADLILPVDIIVADENGFAERRTWLNTLYADAAREGVDLYTDGTPYPHAARQVGR